MKRVSGFRTLLLIAALLVLMAVLVFTAPIRKTDAFGALFTESNVTFTAPDGETTVVCCAEITLLAKESAPEFPQSVRLEDGRVYGRVTHPVYGDCAVYGFAQAQSVVVLGVADGRVFLFSRETESDTQAYYKALRKYTHVSPPAMAEPEG